MAQIILDSANNVIQGDFDTATLSLRTRMQTSTTNATTGVYVVPNGSATSASIQMSNAADPTNASKIVVATNGSTDVQVVSGANGSGTYLPLSFYVNNDIRFQMGTAGELNVRTGPGTVSSGTAGQFLKSNGPGAAVSWGTAGGGGQWQIFTSPGTFSVPASTTQLKVTIIGGGGGGGGAPTANTQSGGGGGAAGLNIQYLTGVTSGSSVAVTVGSGGTGGSGPGASGTSGGTSSFGPVTGPGTTYSATGGAFGTGGAPGGVNGAAGTGGTGGGYGKNGTSGPGNSNTNGSGNLGGTFLGIGFGGATTPYLRSDYYGNVAGFGPGPGTNGGGGGGATGFPGGSGVGGNGGAGVVIVEY